MTINMNEAIQIIKRYKEVLNDPIIMLAIDREDIEGAIKRLVAQYGLEEEHKPCIHERYRKFGFTKEHKQRFICNDCGSTFIQDKDRSGKDPGCRLNRQKLSVLVSALTGGYGIRESARMSGVERHTARRVYRNLIKGNVK